MAVKHGKENIPVIEDNFPVGMRVLAVDDDPTCLKILQTLLRKCNYHVTTTDQSVQALKMLRENKNNYDLVISDVNMPDMNGFKLLELIGLEMDLPVIMLSAYSDRYLVYKGVTHGAVDYLVKPVRIEELKNIWQHVFRKKKLHPKDPKRSHDQDKPREDAGQGLAASYTADQRCKGIQKWKDQDEDEEKEFEDNNNAGSKKKPRVRWNVELQTKFLMAVNQLGLEKAVPKNIVALMNVEGLTKENVARHLRKYRTGLKRVDEMNSQQVNMGAAFGGKDSSHFRMASQDGFGDFRTSSGPRISYPLGRLNSPSTLALRGMSSSGLQPVLLPPSQGTNVGFPSSMDLNQLHGKSNSNIGECSCKNHAFASNLNNTVSGSSNSPHLMLQQNPSMGAFATQTSLSMPSLNCGSCGSFYINFHGSSILLDHSRSNVNDDSHIASKFPTHPSTLREPFSLDKGQIHLPCSSVQGHTGLMDNVVQNPTQQWHERSQDLARYSFTSFNTVKMRSNENYLLEPPKSQEGYGQNNSGTLDDIVSKMIKRKQKQKQNEQ